jgi:Mg2+ and Co2+ transporter CorA
VTSDGLPTKLEDSVRILKKHYEIPPKTVENILNAFVKIILGAFRSILLGLFYG